MLKTYLFDYDFAKESSYKQYVDDLSIGDNDFTADKDEDTITIPRANLTVDPVGVISPKSFSFYLFDTNINADGYKGKATYVSSDGSNIVISYNGLDAADDIESAIDGGTLKMRIHYSSFQRQKRGL